MQESPGVLESYAGAFFSLPVKKKAGANRQLELERDNSASRKVIQYETARN